MSGFNYFGLIDISSSVLGILSSIFLLIGFFILFALAKKEGFTSFLTPAHWWALLLLVIGGVLAWGSYVLIIDPDFKVNKKQWVALVFSVLISVLLWARYAYTVAPDDED